MILRQLEEDYSKCGSGGRSAAVPSCTLTVEFMATYSSKETQEVLSGHTTVAFATAIITTKYVNTSWVWRDNTIDKVSALHVPYPGSISNTKNYLLNTTRNDP